MHILVTNDDGVNARGLAALYHAMRSLPGVEVSVLAPDRNWSASGHVKTLHRPLRVKRAYLADGTPVLASDGAPSDCVALAVLGVLGKPIDMVVSGINPFANLGHDVTYSGTVTAAMEAAIAHIPGIAFSLNSPEEATRRDYGPAAAVARYVVEHILRHGWPADIVLNVNIPYGPLEDIKGLQWTRLGLRVYRDKLEKRLDPRGKPYYWIGGDAPTGVPEPGTDIGALAQGYVSLTPLQLDLTAYEMLPKVQNWTWTPWPPPEIPLPERLNRPPTPPAD
ncbi:MAG: 5'/3'-nucleotidase SurE [Chloroflexi bacterium]|nr:5'/3'-nucleotidase SurE [Chloroflexota bacterium]